MVDIIVRNYQAVEEAKIRVDGITVIRGESNGGKTSFMQALVAGATNRFNSTCIRYGHDHTEVKLRFDGKGDTLSIYRKQEGSPLIKLGDKRWSKLNRDLPNDVLEFTNFGTINVSSSEKYSLNFFRQFQPPLLSEFSQKKVMDILSASKAVDDLNKVRKEVEIRRIKNKGVFEQLDASLIQTKVDLAKVSMQLDETEIMVKADEIVVKLAEYNTRLDRLQTLAKMLPAITKLNRKIELLTDVSETIVTRVKEEDSSNSCSVITGMLNNITQVKSQIRYLSEVTRLKDAIEVETLLVDRERVIKLHKLIDLYDSSTNMSAKVSTLLKVSALQVKQDTEKMLPDRQRASRLQILTTYLQSIERISREQLWKNRLVNELINAPMVLERKTNLLKLVQNHSTALGIVLRIKLLSDVLEIKSRATEEELTHSKTATNKATAGSLLVMLNQLFSERRNIEIMKTLLDQGKTKCPLCSSETKLQDGL